MGENNVWYRIDNGSIDYYTITNNVLTTSTIGTIYDTGYNVNDSVSKLEKEIKELKKIIANLSTMVCTHIGQEQLKKFNNE